MGSEMCIRDSCLTPETPVLMADFSWKALGDVKVGDVLLAFDEYSADGTGRKVRYSRVNAIARKVARVARVKTTVGEFRATLDHRWLALRGFGHRQASGVVGSVHWQPTQLLHLGTRIRMVVPYEPWEMDEEYKAGYLSGLTDGDGALQLPLQDKTYSEHPFWWRAVSYTHLTLPTN